MLVNTFFYHGATGQVRQGQDAVGQFIAQRCGDYRCFANCLTFNQLESYMAMFPTEMQPQLISAAARCVHQGVRRQQLDLVRRGAGRSAVCASVGRKGDKGQCQRIGGHCSA